MGKKFTTVLLVSNDKSETKSFNIPTKHIDRFKIYFTAISVFVILFSLFTFSVLTNLIIVKSENSNLYSKINTLEDEVKVMDSLQIKKKIKNIDFRIFKINYFLKKKGLQKNKSGIGGTFNSTDKVDYTIYDFYDKHTKSILRAIHNIPLGYPYIGIVNSQYGYRTNPFGGRSYEFHSGIDFKGDIGDPVEATGDGIVEKADYHNGYGKCVMIRHEHGYLSLYGHLSEINVTVGQKVKSGDVIGLVGNTGRSTGPHLHYEIRKNGTDINPNEYLNLN